MADAVSKCMDIIDELESQLDQLRAVKKEVTQVIEQLYSPTEYDVLHKRYIQHMTLEEIDEHYMKSDGWAKVACHRATRHVQAILNKKQMLPSVTKSS